MRILLLAICLLITFNQLNANAIQQSDIPSGISIDNTTNEEDSFSFVVWGHPRGAIDGDPPLYFKEILQKIRKLEPDALFVTGDVVNGGASRNKPYDPDLIRGDWARFKRATDELGIPVYVTPGNHDTNNFETRDIFLEFYPQPPYAVTMGKQRFLVLDTIGLEQRTQDGTRCPYRQEEFWPVIQGTSVPSHVPCWNIGGLPFDSAQVEFVRKEIVTLEGEIEHVFIFMHHTHPWAEHDGWWWDRLQPILRGSPTRAVFSGDPYNGKYGYVLQDEIKYIQSAILGGGQTGLFCG